MLGLIKRKTASVKDELLSGITVAMALVPEAVAFSLVAHVAPLVGLYAAFIMCTLAAVLGGRPGMISGATGSMAVVIVSLVAQYPGWQGLQYLFVTIIMTGILEILVGVFRLGRVVRMLPQPVMFGFVNGLAIVIFLAQLHQFQFKGANDIMQWVSGSSLYVMLALVAVTMLIVHFLPKITRLLPSALAAILVITAIVHIFGLDTRTVGDLASTAGGFPKFHVPDVVLSWETIKICLPYAVILAIVGLTESLMTLSLIDELTETRGQENRECVAQGVANVTCGFFGGMGGCAMIGQSMINVSSGARRRLSGIVAGLGLLAIILGASPLIAQIPLAALVGIMFMVVIGTFEWSSFRILHRIPKIDAFVLILVSAVTVFTNLATAVIVGVIVAALAFAWKSAKHTHSKTYINESGSKVYQLEGPLFFASVSSFKALFTPNEDPQDVIVDFDNSRVCDHSALEAINQLAERYDAAGKTLHLKHLSPDCRALLSKAKNKVEVNVLEDPTYHVAD
ncbi:SulP family inorganic anion transporter [Piscirickettsia litoralis]|uniref:Sodium-independent anion transporter n=1 Tax=Piscirickettsia litoralis TaxID=1891921 RepID=A0ABX3A451_9GAMM|nr:SulP family inorganic anion transporter [Piscirickettsia litoralis]ODN43646.1 sodium-independent anion transporter [Piscirickettsia litoralis]